MILRPRSLRERMIDAHRRKGQFCDLVDPYRFSVGGGGGGPADPAFDYVRLSLHGDGANHGTTVTDSSSYNRSCSFSNTGGETNTTTKKMGTASLFIPGASDYVATTNTTDMSPGTGDFSVQGWLYYTDAASFPTILLTDGVHTGRFYLGVYPTDKRLYVQFNGSDHLTTANNTVAINTWQYIEWSRIAGVSYLFVDGVLLSTTADTSDYQAGSTAIVVGKNLGAIADMYLDDVRVTIGVGRNSATYTPPTDPHPDSGSSDGLFGLFGMGDTGGYWDFTDPAALFSDTSRTTPATLNGPVQGVTDKSGLGRHLSCAGGSTILYRSGYAEFQGAEGFVSTVGQLSSSVGHMCLMAVRATSSGILHQPVDADLFQSGVTRVQQFYVNSDESLNSFVWESTNVTITGASSAASALTTNADHVITSIRSTTENTIRLDGVQVATAAPPAGLPAESAISQHAIGCAYTGTSSQTHRLWVGRIYAILWIDRQLTAAELSLAQALMNGLM